VVKSYKKLLADIDKQMADNQKQIRAKVSSDKDLLAKVDNLCTIKGPRFITIITTLVGTNGFNLIGNSK
jgi:hypothetical protein